MEIWMMIVGISMALSGLPQIIKIIKRKSSGDVSILLWVLVLHGQLWWLYYGIEKKLFSVIITNAVCAGFGILILYLTVKYRNG